RGGRGGRGAHGVRGDAGAAGPVLSDDVPVRPQPRRADADRPARARRDVRSARREAPPARARLPADPLVGAQAPAGRRRRDPGVAVVIDVLELPFDQYQRYRFAADLLEEVRPAGATWRILDVGGRTALLRSFLPRDRVALVDLEASPEAGLVL